MCSRLSTSRTGRLRERREHHGSSGRGSLIVADATAILAVTQALRATLQRELSVVAIAPNQIAIESIDLLPTPVPVPRVTIFLYNIHEDPLLKNAAGSFAPTAPGGTGTGNVVPPPITLDLDYMICAWASVTTDEHLLLGDVLRVFHDNAELGPAALGASWAPDEAVQITLGSPSIEDQARIWTTFGFKRFKLSLYYKARAVPIASRRRFTESIVRGRELGTRGFAPPSPGDFPPGVP